MLCATAAEGEGPASVEQLVRLKATICLPVVYQGVVQSVLNLDNFTRAEAFGPDSLRVLKQFRAPMASMLQAAHYRDELVCVGLMDSVTGLPNRRGFDEELTRVLARAARSGDPFTLFVMDMHGFKGVNDALGHHAGDEAFWRVADALQAERRAGDVLAR